MVTKMLNQVLRLLVVVFTTSCASLSPLPEGFEGTSSINGLYQNDPIPDSPVHKKISELVYFKKRVPKKQFKAYTRNDSLLVGFSLTEENRLHAWLLNSDSMIGEKDFKVKRKDDGCYYTRTSVYIIPLFPILVLIGSDRTRFAFTGNSLVLEYAISMSGAAFVIPINDDRDEIGEYARK